MKNTFFGMHWTDLFPNEPVKEFFADILITLFIAFLLSILISNQFAPKKKRTVLRIAVLVPIAIYFLNILLIVLFSFPFAIGGIGCLIIGLVLYYRLLKDVVDNEVRVINHHENGTVSEKGNSINNRKVGVWTYYDDQGEFIEEINHHEELEKSETRNNRSEQASTGDIHKDNSIDDHIEELRQLLQKERNAMFGSPNKQDILGLLRLLCTSKKQALYLIDSYEEHYGSDLLESLKSLSSSYRGIKDYMTPFIELDIVTPEHPHDTIEK